MAESANLIKQLTFHVMPFLPTTISHPSMSSPSARGHGGNTQAAVWHSPVISEGCWEGNPVVGSAGSVTGSVAVVAVAVVAVAVARL